MAYEVSRLVYKAQNATGKHYIDLTQGLSLLNGKNCSQFKNDKPLSVHGSVRTSNSETTLRAAKPSWVVRNGLIKTGAAWRRTLRSAGIRRKSQLNTYAREMRLAFNEDHSKTWGGQKSGGNNCSIIPQDVVTSYASGQYTKDGDEITVWAYAPGIGGGGAGDIDMNEPKNQYAFTQTTAAVPQSGSTDVKDKLMVMLSVPTGTPPVYLSDTYLVATAEYIDSRINDADVEDTDMDQTPTADNDLTMMLAPGEEVADDVIDNVDDEGRWRPYNYETHYTGMAVVSSDANVPGQSTSFEAPLGLLEWTPKAATDELVIDVHALVEM